MVGKVDDQRGATFVETCLVSVLMITGAFAMIRFGIGLDRWSKLEAAIRDGVRDSVASKSSSATYLTSIQANVLAKANSYGLNVDPADIHVCPTIDYALPYPPGEPAICSTQSVSSFGGAFYVHAVDRYPLFWGISWEFNLAAEAFFLY